MERKNSLYKKCQIQPRCELLALPNVNRLNMRVRLSLVNPLNKFVHIRHGVINNKFYDGILDIALPNPFFKWIWHCW